MQFILTLLSDSANYIDLAQSYMGWVGWSALLILDAFLYVFFARSHYLHPKSRKISDPFNSGPKRGTRYILFISLLVLAPISALFFIVQFPGSGVLPLPGKAIETIQPFLNTFAALPIMLAALLLGLTQTTIIGLASGITLAVWTTHNPYTPLEVVLVSLLAYAAFKQRFRTREFRILRNPLMTGAILAVIYSLVFIYSNFLFVDGSLASRIDYAFSLVTAELPVIAIEFLLAGAFTWLIGNLIGLKPLTAEQTQPSPWEHSLPTRIIYSLAPLAVLLLVTVLVGNWLVAGKAANSVLENQLKSSAQLASDTLPYFLETGQNLIQRFAQDQAWFNLSPEEQARLLRQNRLGTPFFDELYLIGTDKSTVSAYPPGDYAASVPSPAEVAGLDLAFQGVPIQRYTATSKAGARSAQISFIAGVLDPNTGVVMGALVGKSSLATNPLTQPVLENLSQLKEIQGSAMILDENMVVLYHTDPNRLGDPFQGVPAEEPRFYEDKGTDGTRNLVYFHPSSGYSWSVVLSIPARQSQELALEIAGPMLVIILVTFVIACLILILGLRFVTQSLKKLSLQANRMASGQLDQSVVDGRGINNVDEVGLLGSAFEQMRLNLKARMDELNRLLVVSQGVASTLEIETAIKPVLESAVNTGASSVRIVLGPAALPDTEIGSSQSTRFGYGASSQRYAALDEALLEIGVRQDRLAVSSLSRARGLNLPAGIPKPEALLSIALRHEQIFYGILWLGFDQPHVFSEEEVRFITTLGGQTALAASNARLFQNAEVGRQRLASILASTADPVLVTDHQDRLILANPAAWHALGLNPDTTHGHPVNNTIMIPELANLLRLPGKETSSIEISALDQRIYLATASPIIAGNRTMGRVCILRDVTHFKELDALKSDFVSTVSHDLRSPLTLMRGYATMLDMVGTLNEQQTNYTQKIINGVDIMSSLVNNLLDLGRIEAGIHLQLEFAEVSDILQNVMEPLQGTAAQKQISLSAVLPTTQLPPIQADMALLQQALHNLIENAIKYTDPGGKVRIQVRQEENHIIFVIADSGIGIAPIDQPRLFEKFYRGAQRDARKRTGSGLGLAIVKSIADRHNGKVWVESHLGKGSIFSLLIPLRQTKTDAKSEKSP